MLLAVHAHGPGPGHAHEQHVYLLVHVLPDAASRLETHQVGVQVTAPFQRPDGPLTTIGAQSAQVHRVTRRHTASSSRDPDRTAPDLPLLGVARRRDLETTTRALAAVAVLLDLHPRR